MTRKVKKLRLSQLLRKNKTKAHNPKNATFIEHLHEIRIRLFWVIGFFIFVSALAFPFRDALLQLLLTPIENQQLYYLTPAGGFSFIIKICTYAGLLASIPVLIYHLYRYVEPLMPKRRIDVVKYVSWSTILAMTGVAFAYTIILPTALHFLTNLDISGLQVMMTADSYLSFIIIYLLGTAILFQIPLILLIINSIKPLKPKKLLGIQRYVIVGAFLIAAIISPTMDIMNQILLALPVVIMFQLGIAMIWLKQWSAKRKRAKNNPMPDAEAN